MDGYWHYVICSVFCGGFTLSDGMVSFDVVLYGGDTGNRYVIHYKFVMIFSESLIESKV